MLSSSIELKHVNSSELEQHQQKKVHHRDANNTHFQEFEWDPLQMKKDYSTMIIKTQIYCFRKPNLILRIY